MVAIYGGDQPGDDHWLSNLPAEEVVIGDPSPLPLEQTLAIADASKLVTFTQSFQNHLSPKAKLKKFSELLAEISKETDISPAVVRKVSASLLAKLAELVETSQSLNTPSLLMRPRSRKSRNAEDTSGTRNLAILLPRQKKPPIS